MRRTSALQGGPFVDPAVAELAAGADRRSGPGRSRPPRGSRPRPHRAHGARWRRAKTPRRSMPSSPAGNPPRSSDAPTTCSARCSTGTRRPPALLVGPGSGNRQLFFRTARPQAFMCLMIAKAGSVKSYTDMIAASVSIRLLKDSSLPPNWLKLS